MVKKKKTEKSITLTNEQENILSYKLESNTSEKDEE